jgi:glycosyltransferase involved in cell wall biosynthesis
MNVLSISYGRALFDASNPERRRMEVCARATASYHMIIFTLLKDGYALTSTDSGLVLHPTNSRSRLHMVFDAIRIGRKVVGTNEEPWVITAQDPFEAGIVGFLISKICRRPLNVQEHGDFFSSPYWRRDTLSNRLRFVIGKFILRRAHTVRVVSMRIRRTMLRLGIPSERILYLPVRSDTIQAASVGKTDLHEEYPDASTIVLSLGRLVSQKNIPLLIRAFSKLHSTDPRALLLVVGSGNQLSQLKQMVEDLGLMEAVVFRPWSDDPYALMSSADIFACSSDWEGWARVLIEAMAAGTSVVTTDVGCAGEILIHNKHGFVVPPRDESAFANGLILLSNDDALRQKFGTQAQHDVQSVHVTESVYVEQWSNVWKVTFELVSQ